MKILIAADMEGITGVTTWNQVDTKHPEYSRFRRLMTQDVNAAVRGAYEAVLQVCLNKPGHLCIKDKKGEKGVYPGVMEFRLWF